MPKYFTLLSLTLLFAYSLSTGKSAAQANDRFSCVADQTTGFKWDGKKWITATFPVSADKIALEEVAPIKSSTDDREFNYVVKKVGYSAPVYECARGVFQGRRSNQMNCGGLGYGFSFDFRTMRYQEYHGLGYVDGQDREGASPLITIGRCTRVQ